MRRAARDVVLDVLIVALVIAPLVPVLTLLAHTAIGRFGLQGDFATLELQTRLVPTGATLLGPYSRFGFNHPGPMYFFTLAPVYFAMGGRSLALFVGPALIAGVSMATIALALRRLASTAHALGASLVLSAWWAAFGSAVDVPWNPIVIVLPLLAFTVLAALVAAGRTRAAVPAVLFGMFAAETHLSCVPYVVALLGAAVVALVVRGRKEPGFLRAHRRDLVLAVAACAVVWLPPAIEQVLPGGGNVTKVAKLFLHRPEPAKPWGDVLAQLARVTAWLPERIESGALAREDGDPDVMWSTAFELGQGAPSSLVLVGIVVVVLLGGVVAWKKRDAASGAILALSALGTFVALLAFRGVVGISYRYLLFWGTTGIVAALAAAFASFAAAVEARARTLAPRAVPVLAGLFAVVVAGSAFAATRLTQASAAKRGAGVQPPIPGVPVVYRALVAKLDADHAVPVIHGGPGWHVNTTIQLELVKDGRPLRIMPYERWLFGRQFEGPQPGEAVLHVYAEHAPFPLETKPCLTLLAKAGDVALYVSPVERFVCPPPAAVAGETR